MPFPRTKKRPIKSNAGDDQPRSAGGSKINEPQSEQMKHEEGEYNSPHEARAKRRKRSRFNPLAMLRKHLARKG